MNKWNQHQKIDQKEGSFVKGNKRRKAFQKRTSKIDITLDKFHPLSLTGKRTKF